MRMEQSMTCISRTALVPYSSQQMFALVDDVERYPQFLPWCRSSRVISRDEDEVRASIEVAKGAFAKSFTTSNRQQKNKMIEIRLLEGPFRRLEGFWRFDALSEGACKVSLDLEFEFSSTIASLTMGPIFSQVASSLVDSFIKRAAELYGK